MRWPAIDISLGIQTGEKPLTAKSKTASTSARSARISTERVVGLICALLVVVLFAGFTLVSRIGSKTDLGIEDLAALRFGVGALALMPVFLKYGLAGLTIWQAGCLAFLGGIGFALFAYSGLFLAPAAHGAVLLHGTLPLFTFLIVVMSTRSAASRRGLPGIILIGLGIALMASDSLSNTNTRQLLGDACLLIGSICWSAYGVMAQRLKVPPLQAAAIVAVLSMLVFWPVYLPVTKGAGLFAASIDQLMLQAVYQGVLIGAFSILIYTRAVVSLGATGTALFTAAVPCVTTIAAVPLLGEIPTMAAWVGVFVVSIGMVIAALGRRNRPATDDIR